MRHTSHLTLALAALVAVGCATGPGTPAPASSLAAGSAAPGSEALTDLPAESPVASEAPTSTDAPVPSTAPTPTPELCDMFLGEDVLDIELESTPSGPPDFWQPLLITRITRVGDPVTEVALPDEQFAGSGSPQFLFGGQRAALVLTYEYITWADDASAIDQLRLRFTPSGSKAIDLPFRLRTGDEGPEVVIDVPDVTASGQLDIEMVWHDTCFRFESSTTTWLLIDPPASVNGCATGRSNAFDELSVTFAEKIDVGSTEVNLNPYHFYGKVTSLVFSGDVLPPYTGFDKNGATVSASPGASIAIADDGERTLSTRSSSNVIFFRRGELNRWLEGGWIHGDEPEAEVVFESALISTADGFAFTAPTASGRYVAQPLFDYNSACSYGLAGLAVGVDIE